MLVLAGLATLAGVVAVGWSSVSGVAVPAWANAAVVGLSLPIIGGIVLIRFNYWREISNSVEITAHQLPEIHAMHVEICDRMGIASEDRPRLYLKNGDGTLNAFAAKCKIRRTYVVIYSDIMDLAYDLDNFDAVKFVLAHELGHIHCGHVSLWRLGITALPRLLYFGKSVTRAQEYTADRCAAFYAPEGAPSMIALYCGKRFVGQVDLDAYFESVAAHNDGFWLKFANFWSGHAVGFRRMEPLRNLERTGWDVHGKML